MSLKWQHFVMGAAAVPLCIFGVSAQAQMSTEAGWTDGPGYTYADIADMADSAPMVIHAQIRKMQRVENERAPGLKPGHARYYITAKTLALLAGSSGIGESLTYLVDLPFDERGKAPNLKKADVLLFARPVQGRPGELQLVSPGAQLLWSEQAEAQVRSVLREMVSPDAPARITGVSELLFVPGTLAGQGDTQIFLRTRDGSAASITMRHQPGTRPVWGVSFSELVADLANPPQYGTLQWYRLACFLPNMPPAGANVSEGYAAKQQADADYRTVLGELGPCKRKLNLN